MKDCNAKEQPLQQPQHMRSLGWYVATDYESMGIYQQNDYLHDDLNIYLSTQGQNSSGYFPTEEKANEAITNYKAKWNNPTAKPTTNHEDAFDRAMKGI